ncbi:MAG: cell division topological specificity factor MinE [Xenococcaceae cyanobacterium]
MISELSELMEMIFPWNTNKNSREEAKRRLQLILAHDRANVNPVMINRMREEILAVVARYVEVNKDEMEIALENSDRMTALIANLPIVKFKRVPSAEENSQPLPADINLDLT